MLERDERQVTNKFTFRLTDDMRAEIEKVYMTLSEDGLDMDDSKVIRYLIKKGIEKLKLEGKLK